VQATDSIVEFAVRLSKAFAVVPCCVFPRQFRHRRLPAPPHDASNAGSSEEGEKRSGSKGALSNPVTTYAQLLEYLRLKGGDGSCIEHLPFEGMNRVVYRTSTH
jgi:hypothetical protein